MIPNTEIGKIFNIEKGSLQSSKCTPGEYDFITAGSDWKKHNNYTHDCEALVFAMGASGSLGRTHYTNGKFIASDLCFVLTPKEPFRNNVDLQFYYYFFNLIKEKLVKETATGTSKLAINLGNFSKYIIPIPSIALQIKAREKIERVKEIWGLLNNTINDTANEIRNMRSIILQEAVQGKLVPQDPNDEPASELLKKITAEKEWLIRENKISKDKTLSPLVAEKAKPFSLPNNWIWVYLQDVFEILRGGSPRPSGDPQYFGGDIPWITVGEITKDNEKYLTNTASGLTVEGSTKSRIIHPNDLLLTNSGATLGVPKISRLHGCINDGVALLKKFHSFDINEFAYIFLLSQTDDFRKVNQGMGQPNLNTSILSSWSFPLPPLTEQKRIVAKVEQLMQLCDELETGITKTQADSELLMQAVLQEAFSGN